MESKIAATERLRREDRWEDATWRRDQERRVPLMAEGPGRFPEHVVAKFEAVIGRLEQDESVDKHYAAELHANILDIQKIRGDVEGWEETRESAIQSRNACAAG